MFPSHDQGRKAEQVAREEQRLKQLQQQRQAAIDSIANMKNVVERYHSRLEQHLLYWQKQGISKHTAMRYKLGYAERCPTYYNPLNPNEIMPSHVFPYYHGENLVSIRHRLIGGNRGKYRQHCKGLPNQIFNVNSLTAKPKEDEISFQLLDNALKPSEAIDRDWETRFSP